MEEINIRNRADEGRSSGTFLRLDLYMDANFSKEFAVCLTWTRRVIFLDCLFLFYSVFLSISASSCSTLHRPFITAFPFHPFCSLSID
jgi:hypothetical protein